MGGLSATHGLVLAGLLGITGAACTSTSKTHSEARPQIAVESGGIAVLADPVGELTNDDYVIECLHGALHSARPRLLIISGQDFRDALFPWFEPDTMPANEGEYGSILARPAV